ncbi:MAG: FHA domain-containing protein [Archangium sp.]|nr:FHA domain-containing protein [Archangium sp.]
MAPANPPPRRRAAPPRAERTDESEAYRPSAKLVCTAGPAEGTEYVLEGDEVVIGRAAENPVSVPDTSMSRKHAVLRQTGGGWAVSDLGSGNGTTLNDEPVSDETPLGNGDVIAMGETAFRFVAGANDEAPVQASAPPKSSVPARRPPVRTARAAGAAPPTSALDRARARPVRSTRREEVKQEVVNKRKLFIRVAGVVGILMSGLIGWKAIDNKRRLEQQRTIVAQSERKRELDNAFQEAKRLSRDGKWEEAKARLLELQEADATYEPKSIQNYIERAEQEIPNQKMLALASEALDAGTLGAAAAQLAKVSGAIGPTETLRSALADQLDARIVGKLGEARALLASANDPVKLEQIKVLTGDILAARPDDREALEVKQLAEQALTRLRTPGHVAQVVEQPWLEAQQRFRTGDQSGALSLAQGCSDKYAQCRTLEGQIKEFEAKYKALESLGENDVYALFELDRRIGGGQSSELSRPIKTRLAALFYREASKAKTTGNWAKAIEASRKVLQADPNNTGAMNVLSEARAQARDIYLRGYQLKETSPDEAARLFKEVVAMTPKDDEYHQKADARLAELQKQ